MLDLYFWTTPNGYKVTILLEELGLQYNVVPIHIGKGEQFNPDFLKISPNNKIPVLVDHQSPDGKPITLFESDLRQRYQVIQWLMFQIGNLGPMLGQAHHFRRYAKDQIAYAIERYTSEATRLYRVLDKRLGEAEFLAGEYSIADMAVYPWLRPHKWQGQAISAWPNLQRWYNAVRARPGVQRGLAVMSERIGTSTKRLSSEAWNVLFGEKQFEAR
jgi:GST-like protein